MAIQAGLRDDEVAFPPEEMAPPQPQQLGPLPLNEEPPPLVLANEGDVKVLIRDPRDIYVDPGAESIETASVVCYRQVMPVSEARVSPRSARFFIRTGISIPIGLLSSAITAWIAMGRSNI